MKRIFSCLRVLNYIIVYIIIYLNLVDSDWYMSARSGEGERERESSSHSDGFPAYWLKTKDLEFKSHSAQFFPPSEKSMRGRWL